MTTTTGANPPSLQDRVIKILTSPKTEWPVIEAESTDVQKLYAGYIAILAVIPAAASFIGSTMVGTPLLGKTAMPFAFVVMILTYAASLASVYISALIIDKLAPSFQSTPNFIQALKLVAYASTATYVAGVLNVLPILGALVALAGGIYAIYLFYLGVPVLMKTPADKVIPYMLVSAVLIIVVWVLLTIVVGIVAAAAAFTAAA